MLWSPKGLSFVFYDRILTDRGGVLIGDGGPVTKLSAEKTFGFEVAEPEKVCPSDRNPAYSVDCKQE